MNLDHDNVSCDILKPNIKIAKLKANQIWKNLCSQKIPVKLDIIIQKMGVSIFEKEMKIDGITRNDNEGACCIVYNKNISTTRKRFTVAHEIGHIVLEHVSVWGDCQQFSKQSQEKEANSFAGELLVPSLDLKRFVKETKPSIQEIIDRYWVSKEVAFIAVENSKLLFKIK